MKFQIWCDDCHAWVDEVTEQIIPASGTSVSWLCCDACGNGIVKVTI